MYKLCLIFKREIADYLKYFIRFRSLCANRVTTSSNLEAVTGW